MKKNFINFLVEKKVIPEVSKGIWQFVADDKLKDMLVRFNVIEETQAKQLWREYVFSNKGQYDKNI